jgi:hypothetical protein
MDIGDKLFALVVIWLVIVPTIIGFGISALRENSFLNSGAKEEDE